MLKKRIIFTLIYAEEHFMLSRNFRLQKVGSLGWLKRNYDFSRIAYSIDELVILNATRGNKGKEAFAQHVKELNSECFVPIAAGGGIRTVEEAKQLLRCGADKIVLNSLLALDPKMVSSMATEFGRQCIIASVDLKLSNNSYNAWIENGSHILDQPPQEWLACVSSQPIGELYVNSISRDGTGQGYDVHILDLIPNSFNRPIILAGGAGKYEHFAEGLRDERVDAVATAHLFNFVGNGLVSARKALLNQEFQLASWDPRVTRQLCQCIKKGRSKSEEKLVKAFPARSESPDETSTRYTAV